MAFDFKCAVCGRLQQDHVEGDGVCHGYVSPDPKAEAKAWRAKEVEGADAKKP